jgi:hypothetical protein
MTPAKGRMLGVLLAAALLAGAGCASGPEDLRVTRGFASPATPYGTLLSRHTRSAELYDALDTVAKGWATWKSPQLRAALAEASIAAYRLEGDAARNLRLEEERAGRRVREFHLALYTPKSGWNDLESPRTLWKVYLTLPGGERWEPVRVIYLPKSDKSAVEYPYVSRWTREYAILFPVLDALGTDLPPTLELAGPLGTMRFAF